MDASSSLLSTGMSLMRSSHATLRASMLTVCMDLSSCPWSVVAPIATTLQGQELKSMHTVSIEARNVAWELRVNDIPVLSSDDDASTKMSGYPISVWLITGRNTVSVRILKVEHSTTDPMDPKYCKVVVSGPKGEATTAPVLAQVEAKPAPKSGADLSSSREASFSVTLKHPNPAWATSAKIGKDAATQQLILDKFREFHGLLTKNCLLYTSPS